MFKPGSLSIMQEFSFGKVKKNKKKTDVFQQDQKAFLGSHLEAINRTTQHSPGAEIHLPHALGLKGSPRIESEESHCTLPKVLAYCKKYF